MANNKKSRFSNLKMLNSTLNTINSLMDGIYKTTYNTDRTSMATIDKISQDIEDNITSIISKNDMQDISNVSKLYTRLKLSDLNNDKKFRASVDSLFEDQTVTESLLSMYTENRWIRDLDREYDTILRYMPSLQEALDAKKENVLSSDNFSKNFINESSKNLTSEQEQTLFSERMNVLKKQYDLQTFYEMSYDNAAKYGEDMVYCVPYSRAIADLLRNKVNTRIPNAPQRIYSYSEAVQEFTIFENGEVTTQFDDFRRNMTEMEIPKELNLPKDFKVIIDTRGFLESAYNEQAITEQNMVKMPRGVYETVLEAGGVNKFKFDETVPDNLEMPKDFHNGRYTSADGFVSTKVEDNIKITTPGSVLKRLKHENVILLYVDQTCLGYYYIEILEGTSFDILQQDDHIYGTSNLGFTGMQLQGRGTSIQAVEDQRSRLLGYFAANIAKQIDSSFVNSNQDLAKEIYTILKYNDVFNSMTISGIRISFLPESDVEHIFFKQDPITHRGISDLALSLIPAKLYACLYITNTLGVLTRGQDKRVYYVKQNVEQNIAQTMLNVINQIKRGNFGMREIENMNTILNITGRFTDFVIPVGPSGDPPIQFEVMQGQDFNPNTELLDTLKEMAINPTGIPIEYIQNRQQSLDFAVQATTVNAKVLRATYRRQSQFEYHAGNIETKLYNTQYNENIVITFMLPAPLFLQMTNINQLIQNTKEVISLIADYEYDADTANDQNADAKKAIFIKNMMRKKLTTYLKMDEIEEVKTMSELEFNKKKGKESE